jgi:hypothetical protein
MTARGGPVTACRATDSSSFRGVGSGSESGGETRGMMVPFRQERGAPLFVGRSAERKKLEQLLDAVRSGESRAVVLRGEARVGKTALLEYLLTRASGCRKVHVRAVETEMELAFASLHQLCAPMLDRLDRLPEPQRAVLEAVFGIRTGPPPDRFFVGLAVLSLLAEGAAEEPLLWTVLIGNELHRSDHMRPATSTDGSAQARRTSSLAVGSSRLERSPLAADPGQQRRADSSGERRRRRADRSQAENRQGGCGRRLLIRMLRTESALLVR